MYAFLMRRSIPKEIVRWLVSNRLAYQSAGKNNIVFVNKERDYCEIRGTYTFTEKPFHGYWKAKQDRFRYFVPGRTKPDKAYVTEAAIDAISLFLLLYKSGFSTFSFILDFFLVLFPFAIYANISSTQFLRPSSNFRYKLIIFLSLSVKQSSSSSGPKNR